MVDFAVIQFARIVPSFVDLSVDLALKSAVICLVASGMAIILRRASASLRNLIWRGALAALLLLPFIAWADPVWQAELLPSLTVEPPPAVLPAVAVDTSSIRKPKLIPADDAQRSPAIGVLNSIGWRKWVMFAILGAGHFVMLCRVIVGQRQMRTVLRRADPGKTDRTGFVESQPFDHPALKRVNVVVSPEVGTAVTIGTIRPRIILPTNWQHWPEHRRRAVIAHEMAHVRRGDVIAEWLVAAIAVLYWYQPLVWLAIHRLRLERERACDDLVVLDGVRPRRYAILLLRIADELKRSPKQTLETIGILRGNELSERVSYIFRPNLQRNHVHGLPAIAGILSAAILVIPVAATELWTINRGPMEGPPESVLDLKLQNYWSRNDNRRQSAAFLVERVFAAEGADKAVAAFADIRNGRTVTDYVIDEAEFNALGYRLLRRGLVNESRAMFELNVTAFPNSWNAHDSLAEACLAARDWVNARLHYEQSLMLGSHNAGPARAILEDLGRRQNEG
jgi:beta-lactamase regulating signal transducer with metallopeptidase domain